LGNTSSMSGDHGHAPVPHVVIDDDAV